jgi:hypothetical protein
VIRDPLRRGEMLAAFFAEVTPRLFADLEAAAGLDGLAAAAADEWACFALYACVRGLVAAGGFNRETAAAIDALHERAVGRWPGAPDPAAVRRLISERYAEYGAIGQAGGAAGAASVTARLGEAAARHLAAGDPDAALADLAGALHESLAEGAADAVRAASDG